MREILFKAKRKEWETLPKDQWWVEGYYISQMKLPGYDGKQDFIIERNGDYFAIIQETLCQYIGSNDCTKWENITEMERQSFLSEWNNKKNRKNKPEDWNGKRIWENDIVKFDDEIWEEYYTSCGTEYDSWEVENYGVIQYCDRSLSYDFAKYKFNENSVEADLHDNHNIEFADFVKENEVIGNIFDNPELLEVER